MFRIPLLFLLLCAFLLAGESDDRYNRYNEAINGLDLSQPESACRARDLLRESLPGTDDPNRRAMFRAFLRFNNQVVRQTYDEFRDATTAEAQKRWLGCGFRVDPIYGSFTLFLDEEQIAKLGPLLPADMQAWLKFATREGGLFPNLAEDAGLRVSWQELGERLQHYEQFLARYPNMAPEVTDVILEMANLLFHGLDNSHIAVHNLPSPLDPEVLSAWKSFASGKGPSRYRTKMRKILAAYEANGHLYSEQMAESHQ